MVPGWLRHMFRGGGGRACRSGGGPGRRDGSLHENEREEFLRLLGEMGEDLSREGRLVLDLFLDTEGHLAAEEVQARLAERGVRIDLATVTCALERFCRFGIAQKIKLNGKKVYYEHLHVGSHHDHLMCTRCGAVEEFFEPRLEACQEDVTRRYAFLPFRHRLVIYGLCRRCAAGLAAGTLPLHEAACGEKVRVVGFAGGANVQGRLAAMGLSVGDEVEVVNNAGPVIVSRGGVRLAVGLGLAEKVHVAPARPEVPRGSGAGTGQGG